MGLNADGTLAVPSPGPDYDKAAWFDGSPVPGESGPAVIEGHIDSAANGPSVFFNLGALTPGNVIDIDRADGSTMHFTVDAVRSYPKDDFPTLQATGTPPDRNSGSSPEAENSTPHRAATATTPSPTPTK